MYPRPVPRTGLWISWLFLPVAANPAEKENSVCLLLAAMMRKCWMCCSRGQVLIEPAGQTRRPAGLHPVFG